MTNLAMTKEVVYLVSQHKDHFQILQFVTINITFLIFAASYIAGLGLGAEFDVNK